MPAIALAWSAFQLWISSPAPFYASELLGFSFGIFNNTEARSIHLGFAVFLAFLVFPARKQPERERVPLVDIALAVVAAAAAGYLFAFYAELAARAGDATTLDVAVAVVGVVTLLEATRRRWGRRSWWWLACSSPTRCSANGCRT